MFEKPRVRSIPGMRQISDEIQEKYPEAVAAYDRIYHKIKDYAITEENYELHDRVVQKLHSQDPLFGHYAPLEGHEEGGKPSVVGPVGYWLGQGSPGEETPNTHNEVHYAGYRHGQKAVWNVNEQYSIHAHKWRLLIKWIYPRPGAPNYGYDPEHPGPLPLVHQKLVKELRELDIEQAEKFEQTHSTMFTNLQGAHLGCTGPQADVVGRAEREKARLLTGSGKKELDTLLAVHQERMKFFEKPRELIDSLEKLFNDTQAKLMEDLGGNHRELLQNLERAHRPCTGAAVMSVHTAERKKGKIIRDAGTEGSGVLEEYHVKRMEMVKKF